jgi:hypothetical protein
MDLNTIQLPASVIADLYTSSLIDTGEIKPADKPVTEERAAIIPAANSLPEAGPTWKWLGENRKNILVVVHHNDAVYLPDNELQFLTNMLTACKLSLADVAIVNLEHQPHKQYKEITGQFNSKVALLFDTEPASFGLPMNFPFYQIQPFGNCSFLYAPSLTTLEKDKVEKSKLWVILRRLFNI